MTAEARARHVVAYAIKKDQERYMLVGSPLFDSLFYACSCQRC